MIIFSQTGLFSFVSDGSLMVLPLLVGKGNTLTTWSGEAPFPFALALSLNFSCLSFILFTAAKDNLSSFAFVKVEPRRFCTCSLFLYT
jgi:hypothetical protein